MAAGLDTIVARVQTRSGQQRAPSHTSRNEKGLGAFKDGNVMPPELKDPGCGEQELLSKKTDLTFEQAKDICEYLMPSYSRFAKKTATMSTGNDRLSIFYQNFMVTAKYLNIEQLNEAVRIDVH